MHPETSFKGRLGHAFDVSGLSRPLQAVNENELATRCWTGLMFLHSNGRGGVDLIIALDGWKAGEIDLARPEIAGDGGEM